VPLSVEVTLPTWLDTLPPSACHAVTARDHDQHQQQRVLDSAQTCLIAVQLLEGENMGVSSCNWRRLLTVASLHEWCRPKRSLELSNADATGGGTPRRSSVPTRRH
jgi:hypothetical protein